jgi:hypothetical protein
MCLTSQYWYIVHLIVLCSHKAMVHVHTCQIDGCCASPLPKATAKSIIAGVWEKLNVREFLKAVSGLHATLSYVGSMSSNSSKGLPWTLHGLLILLIHC